MCNDTNSTAEGDIPLVINKHLNRDANLAAFKHGNNFFYGKHMMDSFSDEVINGL